MLPANDPPPPPSPPKVPDKIRCPCCGRAVQFRQDVFSERLFNILCQYGDFHRRQLFCVDCIERARDELYGRPIRPLPVDESDDEDDGDDGDKNAPNAPMVDDQCDGLIGVPNQIDEQIDEQIDDPIDDQDDDDTMDDPLDDILNDQLIDPLQRIDEPLINNNNPSIFNEPHYSPISETNDNNLPSSETLSAMCDAIITPLIEQSLMESDLIGSRLANQDESPIRMGIPSSPDYVIEERLHSLNDPLYVAPLPSPLYNPARPFDYVEDDEESQDEQKTEHIDL